MKLIVPTPVTDALLLGSNVLETAPAAYNSVSSYLLGDTAGVTVGSVITIYEALAIRNQLARSAELDHAYWGKSGLTVTANAVANPLDGAVTADKLIPTNAAALHSAAGGWSATVQAYAGSIYVKAAEYSVIGVGMVNNGANGGDAVNLATGAVIPAGSMSNSPFSTTAGTIVTALGGGWYRLSFTRTPNGAGNFYVAIYVIPNGTNYQSAGDGTSGVYAFGGQVEPGTSAGSYQPTGASGGVNVGNAPATSATWWKPLSVTYAPYSGATSYGVGDRVISSATHRIYQSAQAANSGHALTDTAWWTDIGPTNRWAPFDQRGGTLASRLAVITYDLTPGSADAIAVMDTNAESVALSLKVGGVEVWSAIKYLNLSGSSIDDWLKYFTGAAGIASNVYFEQIPLYLGSTLTVTINGRNPLANVTVGSIAMGAMRSLGSTEVGVEVGIVDFSRKVKDQFGVWSVVERGFSKRMTARMMIETDFVDNIMATLASVRAMPVVFIGEDDFDSLLFYGFYNDCSINLANARGSVSYLSMTAESLTTSL